LIWGTAFALGYIIIKVGIMFMKGDLSIVVNKDSQEKSVEQPSINTDHVEGLLAENQIIEEESIDNQTLDSTQTEQGTQSIEDKQKNEQFAQVVLEDYPKLK
jgi:hypothetical protein